MIVKVLSKIGLLAVLFLTSQLFAQTTEFTYRGILDGSPTGTYDFEFRLFDVATGGTALAVQQRLGVFVEAGHYQAQVDFGNMFPVTDRHLEIGYKNGPGPFITISPREPLTVNAVTQYNINGIRVLSNAGSQNLLSARAPVP